MFVGLTEFICLELSGDPVIASDKVILSSAGNTQQHLHASDASLIDNPGSHEVSPCQIKSNHLQHGTVYTVMHTLLESSYLYYDYDGIFDIQYCYFKCRAL